MPLIVPVTEWSASTFDPLVRESQQEGFLFLGRLRDEWISGENQFSRKGEGFFAAFAGQLLVAVGGLNRESDSVGRLRRFYVKGDAQRRGFGRLLAEHILGFAAAHYTAAILRTDTETADRFYVSLGFRRLDSGDGSTHRIELKNRAADKQPR